MQALQKAAFQADKLCGSDTLAIIYRRNQFNPATMNSQDDSLLMALPAELRARIYDFVFSSPVTGPTNPLALLSTCRQIHGESIEVALKTVQFYVNPKIGYGFQSRLRSLGPLKEHLRHVKVEIPIDNLTYQRATNPFTLIELPLDKLEIKIDMPEFMTWFASSRVYNSIMSAMLYEEACTTPMGATMRRVNLTLRTDWATKEQLYNMLRSARAEKVLVTCQNHGDDIFWAAFSHFKLVDSDVFLLPPGKDNHTKQCRYMGFSSSSEENILEFGQYSWQAAQKQIGK